ncbi:MAG: glucosylceramidase [Acidobacteria bacterium]|nr:MAG: glucosylceramidase [Acidobacteriota bacterium]
MRALRSICVHACILALAGILVAAERLRADEHIPAAAWKRPLGQPLENAGTKKPALNAGHIDDGYWQGAPVGGFGAGTFSRTYRGDFARWHVKAGVHKYQPLLLNQFSVYEKAEGANESVATVLYAGKPDAREAPAWNFDYPVGAGDYYALYPKAWYDYRWEKLPVRLTLEQFSPILPNNYKETSYPVAVYNWHAQNTTQKRVTVSVLFTWTNMVGWFHDASRRFAGINNLSNVNRAQNEAITYHGQAATIKGIVFDRVRMGNAMVEGDGQWAIATIDSPRTQVSYFTTFASWDGGRSVWEPFAARGKLPNSDFAWASSGEPLAGAIAVTFTLEPGEKLSVPMALSWDLPIIEYGHGRRWLRAYTDFFGASGTNAWKIAREALLHGEEWSATIDAWQKPIVEDQSKPLWYRGMLFNELYVLADSGTMWGRPLGGPKDAPLTYSFLECFDYPFYETLDVRFYGSMPLAKWWPKIEKQVMRAFADTVPQDLRQQSIWEWGTQHHQKLELRMRKVRGAVPHDLGNPEEDPFVYVNQFGWQDTNRWKDLNSKFVLLVYRDFVVAGDNDLDFLRSTWPAVKESLAYLQQFDRDGDGLPENDNYPDQTYDEWVVKGESAYCGGLWLGAVRTAEEIAKKLGDAKSAAEYRELFARAQKSYITKLWNGSYFRYDTQSEYRDNIQADMLAGQWYANLTGLGDLVPREMRVGSLHKIYDNNVMKFEKGEMGAVNGIGADGTIITTNEQVQEVWTGTTFGLAAEMLSEGMRDEAFRTAWGIYHITYEKAGYWFRTPEAWDRTGNYRASMYMRPAAIWAMEMMLAAKK